MLIFDIFRALYIIVTHYRGNKIIVEGCACRWLQKTAKVADTSQTKLHFTGEQLKVFSLRVRPNNSCRNCFSFFDVIRVAYL